MRKVCTCIPTMAKFLMVVLLTWLLAVSVAVCRPQEVLQAQAAAAGLSRVRSRLATTGVDSSPNSKTTLSSVGASLDSETLDQGGGTVGQGVNPDGSSYAQAFVYGSWGEFDEWKSFLCWLDSDQPFGESHGNVNAYIIKKGATMECVRGDYWLNCSAELLPDSASLCGNGKGAQRQTQTCRLMSTYYSIRAERISSRYGFCIADTEKSTAVVRVTCLGAGTWEFKAFELYWSIGTIKPGVGTP